MKYQKLQEHDAVILIDPQVDFFPNGTLPVPDGHLILPTLNNMIEAALEAQVPLFVTRDWHPKNHCSFTSEGGPFPAHCIQNTPGAAFHSELKLPPTVILISKAFTPNVDTFSSFQGGVTENNQSLLEQLHAFDIKRVWLAGLTLEYCVKQNALDAKTSGFETHVILSGSMPIKAEAGETAKNEMKKAGIILEDQF